VESTYWDGSSLLEEKEEKTHKVIRSSGETSGTVTESLSYVGG